MVGKKNFFRSEAEKNKLFHIDFDGPVGKLETRLFMSSTEGEGDILFLMRILLASASAPVGHFLVCTISHEPSAGF